jgi:lipoate-protein ligase A
MNEQEPLRILIDQPLCGVMNMAVDEAVLQGVNQGASPATLRFYRWAEPTVSLGYFQKYEELLGQDEAIRQLPMVRRQTGGGAILHDDELTYSLILPLDGSIAETDIEKMYQLVHNTFIAILGRYGVNVKYRGGSESGNSQRGPFFCFARRHRLDLMVEGEKLVGSAQRRIKNAVLQHGSLILSSRFAQQRCAQLATAAKIPINLNDFIAEVTGHLSGKLGSKTVNGNLSDEEQQQLTKLQEKYSSDEWNRRKTSAPKAILKCQSAFADKNENKRA